MVMTKDMIQKEEDMFEENMIHEAIYMVMICMVEEDMVIYGHGTGAYDRY